MHQISRVTRALAAPFLFQAQKHKTSTGRLLITYPHQHQNRQHTLCQPNSFRP